jgi:hypothetical protein
LLSWTRVKLNCMPRAVICFLPLSEESIPETRVSNESQHPPIATPFHPLEHRTSLTLSRLCLDNIGSECTSRVEVTNLYYISTLMEENLAK